MVTYLEQFILVRNLNPENFSITPPPNISQPLPPPPKISKPLPPPENFSTPPPPRKFLNYPLPPKIYQHPLEISQHHSRKSQPFPKKFQSAKIC